jgi:serine/threonine kinase PknH
MIAPVATASARRWGKRKWALVGAAVAAVVAVGAGVAVTVTSGGSGEDASVDESQPPVAPIPVGALSGLLLTPAEAAKAVGTDKLAGSEEMGDRIYDKAAEGSIVEGDCVSLMPGTEAKYTGSGYTAVRRQYLFGRPQIDNLIQVVIAFPSAELAQKFIISSEEAWRKCSGRTVNVRYTNTNSPPGPPAYEVIGPVSSSDGMITLRRTREGTGEADGDWACSIASKASNNIVVEGEVCSRTKDSTVTALVRGMADKVTARK